MLDRIRAHRSKLTPALLLVGLVGLGGAKAYDYMYGDCCAPGAACCHPGSPCCHHGSSDRVAAR